MEVHAHSHTASLTAGKAGKKWTHYLWEFLMLFLAVFCGFLAEYQLEHLIEKDREKQYMQSFIYDLQNDTTNLNAGFPLKDKRIEAIDSVFLFFETNPNASAVSTDVLRNIRRTIWDRHYRRNSTTMDQLKNAGGLRLIRRKNIRDSIAAYDLKWERADFWKEAYISHQEKEKNLLSRMLNAKDLLFNYRTKKDIFGSKTFSGSVRIQTEYLNEYLNTIGDQKITTQQDKRGYQEIEQAAERLISLIKQEYHLE